MYFKHIIFNNTPNVSHLYDVGFNWRKLPRKNIPAGAMELFDCRYATNINGKSHTMIIGTDPTVVGYDTLVTAEKLSKVGHGENEAILNIIQSETAIKTVFEEVKKINYQNFYLEDPFKDRELFRLVIDQLWGLVTSPRGIFLHDPQTLEVLNDEYTNHRFEYPHFGKGTAYERAKIMSPLWHVIEKHNVYLLETQPDGRVFAKHLQFNKTGDKIEVEDSYLFQIPWSKIVPYKEIYRGKFPLSFQR